MLTCEHEVISALKRYGDYYQPKTGSIILLSTLPAKNAVEAEPFGRGFLDTLDVRSELWERWRRLDPRKRALLYYWYYHALPVTEISKKLDMSRMHCYRLRKEALKEIVTMGEAGEKKDAKTDG